MDKHPLAKFREDNGLTLSALADRIGVKSAAVSRWENGRRFPRSDALERIRQLTGGVVTANDFLPTAGTPSAAPAADAGFPCATNDAAASAALSIPEAERLSVGE